MTEELLPFCECGECGLRVTKKGNRFITGHNSRNRQQETLDKISNSMKQFYINNPEAAKEHGNCLNQPYIDNPELRSKRQKKYLEDHPEALASMVKRMREYWSDQTNRDVASKRRIQYIIDHPEFLKAMSREAIDRCSNPEYRKMMSEILIQYNIKHPEKGKSHSKFMKEYWSNPINRDVLLKTMAKSELVKIAKLARIGGLGMCWHHIAYDFLRPKALRVKITDKFHGQIHHPPGIPLTIRGYSLID